MCFVVTASRNWGLHPALQVIPFLSDEDLRQYASCHATRDQRNHSSHHQPAALPSRPRLVLRPETPLPPPSLPLVLCRRFYPPNPCLQYVYHVGPNASPRAPSRCCLRLPLPLCRCVLQGLPLPERAANVRHGFHAPVRGRQLPSRLEGGWRERAFSCPVLDHVSLPAINESPDTRVMFRTYDETKVDLTSKQHRQRWSRMWRKNKCFGVRSRRRNMSIPVTNLHLFGRLENGAFGKSRASTDVRFYG